MFSPSRVQKGLAPSDFAADSTSEARPKLVAPSRAFSVGARNLPSNPGLSTGVGGLAMALITVHVDAVDIPVILARCPHEAVESLNKFIRGRRLGVALCLYGPPHTNI